MKIAAVFTLLLIVLLPVMGIVMTGDGSLKGKLQSFVSYGLSLTGFLLCLLTIAMSIYSVTSDIKQKQIYTVLTKPIRRFEYVLGKVLGVILLDVALLALFAGIIYTVVIYKPRFSDASEAERIQASNEFYTARASLMPGEVDVTQEVLDEYNRREENGQLPPGVADNRVSSENYKKSLASMIKAWKRAAVPGQRLVWEFHNVKPVDPDQSLFIRFKYDVSVNPPDLQVAALWTVGDNRQIGYGSTIETPIRDFYRKDVIRTFHEIEVPADLVAKDGYLGIAFLNIPQLNNTVVIFPPQDGLEVLYKADTFTANFLRAVLLILCRLIFLACLGILTSTFLSFPVAILFCLAVFFTGTISGFVIESFDFLSENLSSVYSYTISPIVHLLPRFDKINASEFLVPGRLLSWSLVAKAAGVMVCIKAVLLLLLALLIFSYREIAKVVI